MMLVRLHVDASAALGIIERRGVGMVRHLDVGTLCLQEQQLRHVVDLRKVEGLKNPGDLCTKYLSLERIDTYSDMMGYEYASGRADATADLNILRHVEDVDQECRARVRSVGESSQEASQWLQVSPAHWRGSFRSARAHRSPSSAGINWNSIFRIVTRTSPHGRIIRDIKPREIGVSEQ